jgi:hypothetical protein
MTDIVVKGHKTFAAGFTGETKRTALVYDFAADAGAYNGKVYILGTLSGKVLIEKVIARVVTAVTSGGSATVIVGHTDNNDAFVDATAGAVANLTADAVAAAATTSVPMILASGKQITMTIGTADLLTGKIVVEVWYKDVNVG